MRKGRSIRLAAGLGAVAMLAVVPGAPVVYAGGTTIRIVDDDGQASVAHGCADSKPARRSIQAAIDASDPDDLVRVCPGTYREFLSIGPGLDGLVVKAVTPGTVVVRPPHVPPPVATAGGDPELVRIDTSDRVTMQGIVLVAPTGGGCRLLPDLVTVSDGSRRVLLKNLLLRPAGTSTLDGPCGFEHGIRVTPGSAARVDGVTVRDFRDAAIEVAGGARVMVTATTIEFHHATAAPREDCVGAGIRALDGATATVESISITGLDSADPGTGTPVLCNGIEAAGSATGMTVRGGTIQATLNGMFLYLLTAPLVEDLTIRRARNDGMQLYGTVGGEVRRVVVRGSLDNAIKLDTTAADMAILDNDFRRNGGTDCLDESSGGGTAGTANTWIRNLGGQSDPGGICAPPA